MIPHPPKSTLTDIFPSPAMARVVVFFLVHPGEHVRVRELMRRARLPSASAQAELRRLTRLGALVRTAGERSVAFAADESHPAWGAWIHLLRSCAHPADVLREALVDAEGLEGAFVYGSLAAGTAAPGSDVDVCLLGGREARQGAERVLAEAPLLVGRELDVTGFEPGELERRAASGNAFAHEVARAPKLWLRGGPATPGHREAA